jgi:hypothetical protein
MNLLYPGIGRVTATFLSCDHQGELSEPLSQNEELTKVARQPQRRKESYLVRAKTEPRGLVICGRGYL